jgi:hypothetical protein
MWWVYMPILKTFPNCFILHPKDTVIMFANPLHGDIKITAK